MTAEEYIQWIVLRGQTNDEDFDLLKNTPVKCHLERKAFRVLRVMVPPAHANEPPEVERIFDILRSGDATKYKPINDKDQKVLKSLHKNVRSRWVGNYTMVDRDLYVASPSPAISTSLIAATTPRFQYDLRILSIHPLPIHPRSESTTRQLHASRATGTEGWGNI